MELEHVKRDNENVKSIPDTKREDKTPVMERRSQEDSLSPYGSGIEFDISDEGYLRKCSTQSPFDGNLSPYSPPIPSLDTSQIPQSSTVNSPPGAKTELQNSPPEPSAVSTESSPMKSSTVQTVGHHHGYDPNRIPASIFSSKPTNPSEWSATSNESLFSIQMGNNSFSTDYAILFGKSGELFKSEDWNGSQSNLFGLSGDFPRLEEWSNNAQSNTHGAPEPSNLPNSLPPVMEVPPHEESTVLPVVAPQAPVEDHAKENPIPPLENLTKEKSNSSQVVDSPVVSPKISDVKISPPVTPAGPATFPSSPRFSNESGNSGSSFAFPLLMNNNSKGNTGSLKAVQEKPEVPQPEPQPQSEQPPQDPKETSNAAPQTKRYWCFPCLPRCC